MQPRHRRYKTFFTFLPFLYCSKSLVTSVKEILLKVNLIHLEDQLKMYLYGDISINNADNKIIILSTIKYIKETQRFST